MQPLSLILEVLLWYSTFIHPIYVGAKICRRPEPKPATVENCVLAFSLLWFVEVADRLILAELIAMRNLYLFLRILLCLYLLHPRYHGALFLYEITGLKALIATHGDRLGAVVHDQLHAIQHQGLVEYAIVAGRYASWAAIWAASIIKQLLLQEKGPRSSGVLGDATPSPSRSRAVLEAPRQEQDVAAPVEEHEQEAAPDVPPPAPPVLSISKKED